MSAITNDRGAPAWFASLMAENFSAGVDADAAYHPICARILREVVWPGDRPDDPWGCAAAARRVAELHDAWPAAISSSWSAAESAAWAARDAAISSSWSAAESARAAAISASWSAAESAWDAAEAAARAFAWTAMSAVGSDWSTGLSAAWAKIRDIVVEELSKIKGGVR